MVRHSRHWLVEVATVLMVCALGACGGGGGDVVTPPPPPAPTVSTIEVTPTGSTIDLGATVQLNATAKTAGGTTLSRTFSWSSSDPSKASVSSSGLVTGIVAGDAVTITASADGRNGSATVTVRLPPVSTVTVSLASSAVQIGQTTQATVVLRDAAGNALSGRSITYQSSNQSIATVSGSGLVTAVGIGAATITATSEGISASATVTIGPRLAEWTVMVFLAADNNLALSGLFDVDEMEQRGSTTDVKVVVQAEYSPSWLRDAGVTSPAQINRPNWNTFRYEVPVVGSVPSLPGTNGPAIDIGNRDMASHQELRDFITWAKQTAPAKRYLLVLWNHGNGPSGLLADETSSPGNPMSLVEMRQALIGGPALDIVDFDMCLMGAYETVVALRGVARTAVFSEELVPGDGNDYREILRTLQLNATAPTQQVASLLVDGFFAGYANNRRPSLTKSAVDIDRADAVIAATTALGTELKNHLPNGAATIASAVARAQSFDRPFLRDFGDAVDSLRRASTDPTLIARIDAVRSALADPVFMLRNRIRWGTDARAQDVRRARGLSILWPTGGSRDALPSSGDESLANYRSQFPTATWTSFLESFLATAAKAFTLDLGVNPLQAYLIWGSADFQAGAEIDLFVFEPTLIPGEWDIYAPFLGTVSANGQFTPDSYDTEQPIEGWTARRFVARGKYYFFAWLFDDPADVRPLLNVYSRLGYINSFAPLYTIAQRPRLSLTHSWLDDPNVSFTTLFDDRYTDMRPVATWDLTNAPLAREGMVERPPTVSGVESPEGVTSRIAPSAEPSQLPVMTNAQRETLRRLAKERITQRRLMPESERGRMRDKRQSIIGGERL